MKESETERVKVGESVRKWRQLRGMKQRELAARLHLSEAAMSNIENDKSVPNLCQAVKLARILDITIEMLLKGPLM